VVTAHRYSLGRWLRACYCPFLNSDGSPGQQHSGAKRDQRKSRTIRFAPKAAGRSFRFQGVNGS
jgi:hypothetical protein